MDKKICIECGNELPHSSFYKHPTMPDGYSNKCKECFKAEMKKRYDHKSQDSTWLEKERERGREKYRRLNYRNSSSENAKKKAKIYTSLRNAKRDLGISVSQGKELHHWDYNQPRNIIVLDRRLHHRLHSVVKLNLEEGIYYYNGEKLDTIEKHLAVIKLICEERGFKYSDIMLIQKLAG